jgi:glycosyltransferase involved in cell wall biosynthesis
MVHPEWHGMARHAYKTVLEWSLKAADHVITVSESMKNEINHFYPHVPISVIFNGFDIDETNSISDLDLLAIRRKFSLPLEFILAVGHLESRKNYLRLVDAIALLRNRGHPCSLIVVGNDSGLGRVIQKRVESANLSCCVKLLSGLSDFEVRCVYKLSSMFVFPSSYEGFGIPILEAMAGNCPMVLSDIPVFREITQDQGVYFPPNDVELMAYAIEKVLYSSSEQQRLVEYGNERVKDFSFQSLAIQMEGVYRSLL